MHYEEMCKFSLHHLTVAKNNLHRKNALSLSTTVKIRYEQRDFRSLPKKKEGNILRRCSVKSRADDDIVKERAERISIFYHGAHSLVALMTQHGRACRRKSKVRPVL